MSQVSTVPENHNLGPKLCQNRPAAVENLEKLVLRRVRTLYDTPSRNGEKWTADKLAPFLGMSDPSGVRKLINGDNRISLAHIQGFCEAFQVTPCELVSPEGAPFTYLKEAEPTLIRIFRAMDSHERLSLLTVLQSRQPIPIIKGRRPKLGRQELTQEQQLLVDLYVQSEPQARDGVMKILRGTAKRDGRAHPAERTDE